MIDLTRLTGVLQRNLTLTNERDATITFEDETAAFQNTLGVYLIDTDGTIRDPKIVFPQVEHAEPLEGFPGPRPGGGPLAAGASGSRPAASTDCRQQNGYEYPHRCGHDHHRTTRFPIGIPADRCRRSNVPLMDPE